MDATGPKMSPVTMERPMPLLPRILPAPGAGAKEMLELRAKTMPQMPTAEELESWRELTNELRERVKVLSVYIKDLQSWTYDDDYQKPENYDTLRDTVTGLERRVHQLEAEQPVSPEDANWRL